MDRQNEVFEAIQSLTSLIEENMKENEEVKKDVEELKKITEYHNKLILDLINKKIPKDEEEYILKKINEVQEAVKFNRWMNAIFILAILIGSYFSLK